MFRFLWVFSILLLVDGGLNRRVCGATNTLQPLPLKDVRITDGFWAPKLAIYKERTIPHSWKYMTAEVKALRAAAGQVTEGDLNGTWGEANLYKFLETVAHSLGQFPDPVLEKRVDEIVDLLAQAQQKDGFVHLFYINSKKPKWDPEFLDGSHTGYVLGHMIEAAIEYHANTGKRAFLDIACKAADEAHEHFLGTNGTPGFDGHAELEMALVELYRVTGVQRYLDLSQAFVEWRGRRKVKPAGPTPRAYFQDEVPFRLQRTLEGHAVRAIFFATGVADLAIQTGDSDFRLAANRFWDSTTLRRMTVTGHTGPRQEHEAFGEDYELPVNGYYESCAACGLADFAHRMFLLERTSDSADVLERVLYNGVLHGISLDGTNSYYQNPLTDANRQRYNSWVCCPPNLSRTLFQVGRYAYAASSTELFINLFVGSELRVPFATGETRFKVETDYPWSGNVAISVEPNSTEQEFTLHLRVPGWCQKAEFNLNGVTLNTAPSDSGYLTLKRKWNRGDKIDVAFAMPVQRVEGHPNIKDSVGRVAIQRGPIVYGFEGLDNGGSTNLVLSATPAFSFERQDKLGGIVVVKAKAEIDRTLTAIPFYALANREKSSQEVWVQQKGLKTTDAWWEGKLYRPLE